MNNYTVKVVPAALLQLQEIAKYISDVLLVPDTAIKWLETLEKAITSLDVLPNRFSLTEDEHWKTKGVHKMFVKGFVVYYVINEQKCVVTVIAVIYGKRDQITALKQIED